MFLTRIESSQADKWSSLFELKGKKKKYRLKMDWLHFYISSIADVMIMNNKYHKIYKYVYIF